jgi:hypothetical protein
MSREAVIAGISAHRSPLELSKAFTGYASTIGSCPTIR